MNILSGIVRIYLHFPRFGRFIWSVIAVIVIGIVSAVIMKTDDISTMPAGWEKSEYMSAYNIRAKDARSASRGNYIIVVYEGVDAGKTGIYASISFNGGYKYLPPVKISDIKSDIGSNPHPAVSSTGTISVAWQNLDEKTSASKIYYSLSTDFGATWTEPVKPNTGFEMEVIPRLYYDSRNALHLFFQAFKGGEFNIYHTVSADGLKFEKPKPLIELKSKLKGAFFPAIYFNDNVIGIVWQGKADNFNDDLFFIKSGNYGRSWSDSVKITNSNKGSNSSPDIVINDGIVYMVYQNNDSKSWSIKLTRGINGGSKWDPEPILVSQTDSNCYNPKISIYNADPKSDLKGDLIISWHDGRDKISGIFYRRYALRDNAFTPELKLSPDKRPARNVSQVVSAGRVLLFWEEAERIISKSNDIHADPPVVFSRSHPEGAWSRNGNAEILWTKPEDESGITGYATIVNKLPDFNPTIQNQNANVTKFIAPGLEDGVTYFHIRAIDGAGNLSRTVHYKIQTSMNPLPMPVIVSPTHLEGKPNVNPKAEFRWAVDDFERLKGFVYHLSKDRRSKPDKFTTDFQMIFDSLERGSYYLTLAAIDKTNLVSSEASYGFTIGTEDDKTEEEPEDLTPIEAEITPLVELMFKFDTSREYFRSDIDAIISVKNIQPGNIAGFSAVADIDKITPPDRINIKPGTSILSIRDLKQGDYYISIKCRYFNFENGIKVYKWTNPYMAVVKVRIPYQPSPVGAFADTALKKLSGKNEAISIFIIILIIIVLSAGYGRKLVFYYRMITFRSGILFRQLSAFFVQAKIEA
jgi:hypothetical protein